MITFLTIIHVVVSVFLILVVLLQQGKGQDFAGAFGGGGSQANVGARSGTTVLHKMTTIAAVMFMLTSLSLTILISRPGIDSVIPDDAQIPITEPVPDAEETPEGAPDDGPDPEP
jgi:preprotein translocase subunit SecG